MELEGLLPYPLESSSGAYPEPDQSSPYHPILSLWDQLYYYPSTYGSRDSAVGIATGCGLDDRGVGVPSPSGIKNFLFSTSSRPGLGPTQPPIQWVPGALSPGVKPPGHEANHSPTASVEDKKMWIYTSTPPYALMA
jgi:hypothetical protein